MKCGWRWLARPPIIAGSGGEDRVFYDDLTLRRTGEAYASQQRRHATAYGLEAGVEHGDLVDALTSGDPQLDCGEALELIDWERHCERRLAGQRPGVARSVRGAGLMGWGSEPHEGWADAQYPDGRWNGGTTRGGDPDPVANQAVCSCGWRAERVHPLPPRPANTPRDEHGIPHGPEWREWTTELGRIEDLCWDEWTIEHYEPLLGYEPHTQLILANSPGGRRHFLDGQPVHAGDRLEVQLPDGSWLPVRYEWSWDPARPATAHFGLGVPAQAREIEPGAVVSFDIPPRAILRWPPRQ